MTEIAEKAAPRLTDLCWPDGRPKIAPVQGYAQGIPWSLHLKAYNAHCKAYGKQDALIDLAGRGCRGGFDVGELDMLVPGWRNEVEELAVLRSRAEAAERKLAEIKDIAVHARHSANLSDAKAALNHIYAIAGAGR